MEIIDNRPPKPKITLGDIIKWKNGDLPSLIIYDENDNLPYQMLDLDTNTINGAYKEIDEIFDDNKEKIDEIIPNEFIKIVIE
jgi:hypothetical protein